MATHVHMFSMKNFNNLVANKETLIAVSHNHMPFMVIMIVLKMMAISTLT